MIRSTTSGRAGIIGNPTDGYGGSMIACSVKNKAVATIEKHNELLVENEFGRKVLRWENDFENKGDYFDIFRSVLRYLKAYDLKAKITTYSNIPVQAGLAGSTSILSSLLSAVLVYMGKEVNRYQLAEINRDIELNYLKCQCGYQDAYMTTFGGLNYLDFRGKEYYKHWEREQYATVENLSQFVDEMPFVVAHTGIKHNSGNFHTPLRERWLEKEPAVVNGYKEIMNIAREGKRAILDKNWDELAYQMNKNHEIQDSLADSGEQNNYMIKVAKKNGGLAAKLAGAGGGGTIIVLTYEPDRVKTALTSAGAETFVDLDPGAKGVQVEYVTEGEAASTK
jgi:galactokinase/mevalonate kinase-like predicted kinase